MTGILHLIEQRDAEGELGAVESRVELDELLRLIDELLPLELRATFLQMREGVQPVSTAGNLGGF